MDSQQQAHPHNESPSQSGLILQEFEISQILYCSLAKQPMDDKTLQTLADHAAAINRMDHITGLLMHSDNVFVQLIEGPPQAVQYLWARLLRDPRHFGIVQIYHRREVEYRACEGWAMRYVKQEDLRALIHEAKEEIVAGRKSAWAPAIERMDFLLSSDNWDAFVRDLKRSA